MECVVEYEYEANEVDELTLKKGDRITDVVTDCDGWWRGTLNGKRGLFPDNFVKVITANSGSNTTVIPDVPKPGDGDAPKMRQKSGAGPHPRKVKAIFSYAPAQEDELQLEVGDVIQFLEEIEEGWWKGELKGQIGIFPSNFVAEVGSEKDNVHNGNATPEVKTEKEKVRNRESYIAKNKVIPDVIPSPTPKVEEAEALPKLPPKPVRETARCFYPYFAQNDDELTLQEGDIVTILSKESEDEGWWRGEYRGKVGVFPDNFVEIITANSPTSAVSSANQPKVTAQERADDSKKEVRPGPGSLPVGTSVVDGIGASKVGKTESKVASQIKAFTKKDGQPTKGPAPLSPISPLANVFGGFSVKRERELKSPLASPSTETSTVDEVNLNSIERSEKLNHLTVSRAKAPKRRPPSTIITREDEHEFGLTNGISGTVSLPMQMQSVKEPEHVAPQPQHAPPPFARSNSHTIHVPDGTVSSPVKETSPGPQSAPTTATVNKPKTAIPWMAELKLKQDTKKSTGLGSPTTTIPPTSSNNNNISTVIVAPPAAANIITSSIPGPIQTKAPPLPVKPNIPAPAPTPTPVPPQQQQPVPVEKPQGTVLNNSTSQPQPSNPSAPVTTRFGVGVGLKRNTSNPTPPVNHINQTGGANNNVVEFVSIEEHNQLKERVASLESEVELLKRQLKAFTSSDRDFKGLIV